MTREKWLVDAIYILADDLHPIAAVPANVVVIHGLPDCYDEVTRNQIGGCCSDWPGVPRIFISPRLDDPVVVLATLVHELIHASVGCGHTHNEVFEIPAREIGLKGELHATVAGPNLRVRLREISNMLGTYPGETE